MCSYFAVASHLPYLFHIVTLLVHTGPVSLRASIHGLVINIIHSLCTCTKPSFGGKNFYTIFYVLKYDFMLESRNFLSFIYMLINS